ncbi:MAG: hypothetical protein MJZ90_08190 [Bacteroidales bacterium]|nr:hypothetical protein [Bacteroidales bacterium]
MTELSSNTAVASVIVCFLLLPTFINKIRDVDWRERLFVLSKVLVVVAFAAFVGLVIYEFLTAGEITKAQVTKTVGVVFSLMYSYWRLYFLKGKELRVKEKLNRWKTRANNS